MTVGAFLATAKLPGGANVVVDSGHVTLDETWAPYVQGTIRVPLEPIGGINLIDPRLIQRLTITAEQGSPDVSRTFDVGLRSRTIDPITRELEIEFASDEAVLMDAIMSFGNPDPWVPRNGTLQDILDWTLLKVPSIPRNLDANPAALSTGTAAAYGARSGWARSFVSLAAAAVPTGGPATVARFQSPEAGTVNVPRGMDSYGNLDLAAPGVSGAWLEGPRVNPGQIITVSRFARFQSTTRWVTRVRFHDGAGSWIGGALTGTEVGVSLSGNWARPSWTGLVPAGARYVSIQTVNSGPLTVAVGDVMVFTGLMTEVMDTLRPWHADVLTYREGASGAIPMPAKWDATNLVINPKARVNASNWTAVSGCTIERAAVVGVDPAAGTGVIRVTQTATGGRVYAGVIPAVTMVSPGQRHTGTVWVKAPASATVYVGIQYFSQDGANRGVAEVAASGTGAWQRLDITSWVPKYTAAAVLSVRIAGVASGTVWDIDQAMLVQEDRYAPTVPDRIPYFDGSMPNTADYSTSWESGSNGSPSIRTAVPGERPQSLYWWGDYKPIWDYLDPFLQEAGYRLWCDEGRNWRCDPVGESRPGSSTVTAGVNGNMLDASDRLSRDEDTWADGVILRYTYVDVNGIERESFGNASVSAATTLGAKIVILDRPGRTYIGNSEAQRVLAQLRSRGRLVPTSALGELGATPGTAATITTPDGQKLAGTVESVTFNLQNGVADITPRDMTVTT